MTCSVIWTIRMKRRRQDIVEIGSKEFRYWIWCKERRPLKDGRNVLNLNAQEHREGQRKHLRWKRLGDLFWGRLYFYELIRKPEDIEINKHLCLFLILFVIRIIFLIFHQRPKFKAPLLSSIIPSSVSPFSCSFLLVESFQFCHHRVSSLFPSLFSEYSHTFLGCGSHDA